MFLSNNETNEGYLEVEVNHERGELITIKHGTPGKNIVSMRYFV